MNTLTHNPAFKLREIDDYEKYLKDNFTELSEYERLKLAIELQRNRMMSDVFVLSENAPSVFEAIAIALGYEQR